MGTFASLTRISPDSQNLPTMLTCSASSSVTLLAINASYLEPYRAGLALIPYLDASKYYAIDINKPLLEDGYEFEIISNGLQQKFPRSNIKVTHDYDASNWGVSFDYAWSFSLWTHLDTSECEKCLRAVSKVLKRGGVYLTTCFLVNDEDYEKPNEVVSDVTIRTYHNRNSYHHRLSDFIKMGDRYGLTVEALGKDRCCPRNHDFIKFTRHPSHLDRVKGWLCCC